MFQFTTTNVINSNQDLTTGKALWSGADGKSFNVKRVNNFKKENIVKVTRAPYMAPRLAKAVLDFTTAKGAKGKAYRLSIYIRLDQSCQSSYYSNDMVFKGKPLSVEFNWNKDMVADVVKDVEKLFKKYSIAVYEKPIVKIEAKGTTLEITATDQYQRFYTVELEEFDPEAYHGMGEYTPVCRALEETHEDYDSKNTIYQGIEGFGTYEWLLHNLRLPTTARTRVFAMNSDETPIPGAHYDEFVIHYCVNRGILGTNAVGDLVKSMTTHVFYVNHDVVADFESALSNVYSGIEKIFPEYLKDNKADKVEDKVDHGALDTEGES